MLFIATGVGHSSTSPYDDGILYLMPVWGGALTVSDTEFAQEVSTLRTRFPEGGPVRVGFSVYVTVAMERWDVTTEAEAAANLTTTVSTIDAAIARARQHNLPISLVVHTPVRDHMDAAQRASQSEDRRVMQWFSDGTMADGWWSFSRYARRQHRVRELYVRAVARILANRMARYPETIVAAAGDGEIELAYKAAGPPFADYSPFATAEFRDWLRAGGLYSPGQRFAGQAFANAARYFGDATPGIDSNGDGHTLNGDMGTAFSSWSLRYFDWPLSDPETGDPRTIPESIYRAPGFNPFPDAGATLFDPPRDTVGPQAWLQAWLLFREAMVSTYNVEFAQWMTTTPDLTTGATIPSHKWFSYQIPADYLFGHTPANPDWRYFTSASSWRSADIRPYGGSGTTAFNTRVEGTYFRTLASVAPLFGSLDTRWSILEWNPSFPSTADPAIYREDVGHVETHRPTIVAPYAWRDDIYQLLGSGFETALVEMITRLRSAPWRLQASGDPSRVRLRWAPPDVGAPADSYQIEVGNAPGAGPNLIIMETGSPSTILEVNGTGGTFYLRVRARRGSTLSAPSNEVRIDLGGAPPAAPSALSAVVSGSTMTFNWLAPASRPRPSGYVIEAGSAPGLANLASMPLGPATTFVIPNVPLGSYYVRVRAENSGARSAGATNDVLVTSTATPVTHCTPVTPPPPPNYRLAGTTVTFEWDPPASGAQPVGYQLEAGSAPGLANLAVLPLGPSRVFSATAPPGTYYVRLRALGVCGTSAPGATIRLVV